MSMNKKKKAALAAVMQYLETERHQMAAAGAPERIVAIPVSSTLGMASPYGFSGRNAQMQIRTMMQYRTFRG
ncbi:MAG: hypothetical protein R6T92_02180 [Desulfosalsimonadaceae bacterium]